MTNHSKFQRALNVLIVEDNQLDRKMLESMLAESASITSKLKSVNCLKDATDILQKEIFDVVILDLNLPDIKGMDTLKVMSSQFPCLPIVVNTGAYEDELGLKTLGLGAQDFLIKGKYNPYMLNKVLHYAIERKRLEIELVEAYGKLKDAQSQLIQAEKMRVVGNLASGVAHEVKNPLSTILYGITFLDEQLKIDDPQAKEVIANIKEATDRANGIITDLLNFSSLSKLRLKDEHFNEVLDKAIGLIGYELDKKNVEVIREFGQDIPEIKIDRNRVEQVLINLTLNALHAMDDKGKLILRTFVDTIDKRNQKYQDLNPNFFNTGDKVIVCQIMDTGKGIPEDKLGKIFDPFFTTRRGKGGVGLGLSVSHNIIEIHRGHLGIANCDDTQGACATVIFHAE